MDKKILMNSQSMNKRFMAVFYFKYIIITLLLQCLYIASIAQKKVATTDEAAIFKSFKQNPTKSILPDFSYAGYHYGKEVKQNKNLRLFNVTHFGIQPNSTKDQTKSVQKLIDSVGKLGGGVIFFPKGKYLFNMDKNNKQFLQINYSNIIIRGEGSSDNGTVLFNGNPLTQEEISPWLSPAFIQTATNLQNTQCFWGIDYIRSTQKPGSSISTSAGKVNDTIQSATILTDIKRNSVKGESKLYVNSTKKIKSDDVVLIGLFNTSEDGNLIKDVLSPKQIFEDFEKSAINAGPTSAPTYQWLVEVDKVLNDTTIILKQPLRRNIEMKYAPVVAAAPMLQEIGIEHLQISSAWNGYYCHHGCDKNKPSEGKEMDYGWTGINFCRVKHGWMKDVVVNNFTNPVYLLDSRNVTISNMLISGADGHSGIKIYSHASDNLITNVKFKSNYTHVLSGEGNAYGNVFSHIVYEPLSQKPGYFDFHGFSDRRFSPPAQNLFENIIGMSQVNSGGAPNNMPQTANYNTWWNVQAGKFPENDFEVFRNWMWSSEAYKKNHLHDHHKMYPKSILVGVHSSANKVLINNKTSDIKDEWIYTEKLNQSNIYPKSLYQAQLALRLKKK